MCKKVIILGLAAIMLSIGGTVFAQSMVTLDQAISYSANEIESRLEQGAKVMVLNFKSPSQHLSSYVLDEMTNALTRSGRLTTVERANLEFLLRELKYERSGDISDEAAQSIGLILGVQYIISGLIEEYPANYVIQFKTMPVEPAALQNLTRVGVVRDAQITNLLGSDTSSQARTGTSGQTVAGTGQMEAEASSMTGLGAADLGKTLVLSTGGGLYGKIDIYNVLKPYSTTETIPSFGVPVFLNAELFSYLLVELSPYYRYYSYPEEYLGMNLSALGVSFSLFGQYPIRLADRFTLFPLLGIGYDMPLYLWDKDNHAARWEKDMNISDMFDFLFVKPGVGVNYNLTENLRLSARFLWDFVLYNKSIADQNKEPGVSVIQHGPSLFLGVSYVFFRM
jgi:hypothetical protein